MADRAKYTVKKLNTALQKEYDDIEPLNKISSVDSDSFKLKLKEHEEIIEMRRSWSNLFKNVLIGIVAFEIGLTVLVGFGVMQFEDEWFLRIIILGGFAQILAMPLVVAQFLFNNKSKIG